MENRGGLHNFPCSVTVTVTFLAHKSSQNEESMFQKETDSIYSILIMVLAPK